MSIEISDAGKKALTDALAEQRENNPFHRDGDILYCRYDTISIEFGIDGVTVSYGWRGQKIAYHTIDAFPLQDNTDLTLTGIDGRIKVEIY